MPQLCTPGSVKGIPSSLQQRFRACDQQPGCSPAAQAVPPSTRGALPPELALLKDILGARQGFDAAGPDAEPSQVVGWAPGVGGAANLQGGPNKLARGCSRFCPPPPRWLPTKTAGAASSPFVSGGASAVPLMLYWLQLPGFCLPSVLNGTLRRRLYPVLCTTYVPELCVTLVPALCSTLVPELCATIVQALCATLTLALCATLVPALCVMP